MLLNIPSKDEIIKEQTHVISRLRAELSESLKESAALYDYSPIPYLTIDLNCVIKRVNFQAALLIGHDRKQLINTIFLNFITVNSQKNIKSSIAELLDKHTKQSCEIEMLQRKGGMKQLILESIQQDNDLIRLSLIDMTRTQELTLQVLELKKSLNQVNNLFQNSTEAIASLDSDLTINFLNHSFSELFSNIFLVKIQPGTNIGAVLYDFPEIKQKITAACKTAIQGQRVSVILEDHKNDEGYYCHEIDINYFYNQYIQRNELIMCIRCLTEYKLEDKKQHEKQADISIACKTSTMGEMASVFAHEINQPLTALIAYSRSCLYMIKDQSDYQKTCSKLVNPLEQMAGQAELAGKIINNMKNIMQDGKFYVEKTDINVLINESLSILKYELQNFKFTVSLNLKEDLPQTTTNKIHIMQIIINLARNSIEAFQTISAVKPELLIETREVNGYIVVHVIDNGPGIPTEVMARILNTYYTTKPQGTGLGLGICRSLIEAHGGKLSVHKHTKKGAWFSFTLPII